MTETTSISVTVDVRERVKRFAEFKDETYSSILDRIMNDAKQWQSTSVYGVDSAVTVIVPQDKNEGNTHDQ